MRPQRVRIIGSGQRLRDVEEAVERNVDHAMPLRGAHSGKYRVVVNAGIVDQDLDRALGPARPRAHAAVPAASVTSNASACARPPAAMISLDDAPAARQVGDWRARRRGDHPRASRRQMALPMPPLPPVTRARLHASWSSARRSSVEHQRRASAQQQRVRRRARRTRRRATARSRADGCSASQSRSRLDPVESATLSADSAQADEVSDRGGASPSPARASAPCTAIACAAYSIPHAAPRRPCARSGLSGSAMADRACSGSGRRPIAALRRAGTSAPWCGMCAAIQVRSSCTARPRDRASVWSR